MTLHGHPNQKSYYLSKLVGNLPEFLITLQYFKHYIKFCKINFGLRVEI